MDFKSLLNKLDSMDAPAAAIAAPKLPEAVQLDESASLRVLAGQTTYLAEAKKSKPDFADLDKDGDKKEPMKKAAKEAKKDVKTDEAFDPEVADKEDKKKKKEVEENFEFQSKFMKMVEAKKKPSAGLTKKEKSETVKKAKKGEDIGKAGKNFDKVAKAAEKGGAKDGKAVAAAAMWKNKAKAKKTVKESVEQKLSFRQMVQLVQESGGQQQIDAKDKELFAWAQRVAASKFNESVKSELYAGMVYERMGGVFEMYDVLAEDTK